MNVRSQTFNPLQYKSQNIYGNNLIEEEKFEEIVTKGGEKSFKVDIGHFDKLCKHFQDKCHLKIKNLKGRDKEDFKLMVSYVRLLYGTNYYDHLHKKVVKYFSNLDRIQPGTVGGYFGGCLVKTSFDQTPSCSVACAGAVPRPKDEEGWSFCDQAVIFADLEYKEGGKQGYTFTVLKEPESPDDLDPCYIFVEHQNLHEFEGFSEKEKDELRNLGVDKLYLIGCDDTGTEYTNLYSDIVNLNDVKHRAKSDNTNDTSLALAIILIVIFLLLIVVFFGWRFYSK